MLGNKIDREDRCVSEEEGEKLAEQNGILFKEVSARNGRNVQEFFKEIASLLPEVTEENKEEKPRHYKLDSSDFKDSTNETPVLEKEIPKKA